MENKKGLKSIGFIMNLKTYLDELQMLLDGTTAKVDEKILDEQIEEQKSNGSLKFKNKFGYESYKNEMKLTYETAQYVIFDTSYETKDSEKIFGWFYRKNTHLSYLGVYFNTKKGLDEYIIDKITFKMGDLLFDHWHDAHKFLKDLADNAIPEVWVYNKQRFPMILKSYIKNVFAKLRREGEKILENKEHTHIIFHSNLLNKYFQEISIIAEKRFINGEVKYFNPFRQKCTTDLTKLNFNIDEVNNLERPKFFNDINQVIFQPEWLIDKNSETFKHIIEVKKDKFPVDHQGKSVVQLAKDLATAVNYAVAIAERNYKFIIPQYRFKEDKIQLLMPIYLRGFFTERPDFALVLDPDDKNKLYIPQAIIPLCEAYQNARLIARPDNSWLVPDEDLTP